MGLMVILIIEGLITRKNPVRLVSNPKKITKIPGSRKSQNLERKSQKIQKIPRNSEGFKYLFFPRQAVTQHTQYFHRGQSVEYKKILFMI